MVFLWIFLPVTIVLSQVIRKTKYQNLVLLAASLIFYAWGEPRYIVLLLFSVVMNWGFGLAMDRFPRQKKVFLVLSVVGNLSLLGYFKYCNFFLSTVDRLIPSLHVPLTSIALPIGISFFTFQAMSYVIDLYRGEYKVQRNLLNLMLYISFFPQLIAGPIVRYRDIDAQITSRSVSRQRFAEGFRRFAYGLGKKVILANLLAGAADNIFALETAQISSLYAWLGAIFYTLQIYYDFSGYSDMAIGLGRMFGFDFLENFNYPYISSSIQEFWRRWHISLSTWFREYLYIPLGGNRKGKVRTYRNLMIVFLATGLWHGASWNFVGWGLYHGLFLVIERLGFSKVLKKDRIGILSRIYTLLVVTIGWVFFRVESGREGLAIVLRMLMPWRYGASKAAIGTLVSNQAWIALILGILGCGLLQQLCGRIRIGSGRAVTGREGERRAGGRNLVEVWKDSAAEALWLTLVLVYCIILLANNTYNPFIYFRF